MKYIDAEKLIAEIERRIESWTICGKNSPLGQGKDTCESRVTELSDMLSFITSLQQEQPESGSSEKPNNLLSEKQEQPEVDLDKFTEKIRTFQERYKHPEIMSIKGAMAFMARMFYQYPNVAKEWYEQLSKATMD